MIFDIDGVLCDNSHALHDFIKKHGKDKLSADSKLWDLWWSTIGDHPCDDSWLRLCQMLFGAGYFTIILTNRDDKTRATTEAWLAEHGAYHDLLLMWSPLEHDFVHFKEETVASLVAEFDIYMAFDDDPSHISMYKRMGVPAAWVNTGKQMRAV